MRKPLGSTSTEGCSSSPSERSPRPFPWLLQGFCHGPQRRASSLHCFGRTHHTGSRIRCSLNRGCEWVVSRSVVSCSKFVFMRIPTWVVAVLLVLLFFGVEVPRSDQVPVAVFRSEEHTSELQSHHDLVCRL